MNEFPENKDPHLVIGGLIKNGTIGEHSFIEDTDLVARSRSITRPRGCDLIIQTAWVLYRSRDTGGCEVLLNSLHFSSRRNSRAVSIWTRRIVFTGC